VTFGTVSVPRGTRGGAVVAEVRPAAGGTIAMRGPMVPRAPFPPGIERTTLPQLKLAANGFVDTGFACWSDRDKAPLLVTGPPPGVISVGGYRLRMRDVQAVVAEIDPEATLAALPNRHSGHRLAGASSDPAGMRGSLAARGILPLVADAFRSRAQAIDVPADTA
jgi:hypothetical protein